MRVSVVIQSATSATVTIVPGLLASLFLGRQESTREARDIGFAQWVWTDTDAFVEPAVEDAIERAFALRAVRLRHDQLVKR